VQTLTHTQNRISAIEKAVYSTICYFDVFRYPLKAEEILRYCTEKISGEELEAALQKMLAEKMIFSQRSFYFLEEKGEASIQVRLDNEIRLTTSHSKIKRYAKLVNSFPFVEAVFISGSVSKGLLTKDGDVDYFIIARHNRVWLCRTLLIIFKKIFLLNSKKYFCVNYFIDSQNLRVPDSNLFVATEIKTLIPVFSNEISNQFVEVNDWTNAMLPNYGAKNSSLLNGPQKKPILSRWFESLCSGTMGEKLDNYFFKKTIRRWQEKFPHFDKNEFDLNMRSYKNVSKHHPQGYQNKVLQEVAQRMRKFEMA
jgi:hypothetical protein